MKLALILMMMVTFVTMTVSTAQANFAGPACSSQLQVAEMCYPAGMPAAQADASKKSSPCCDLFPDTNMPRVVAGGDDFSVSSLRIPSAVSHPMVRLRPPRA